MHLMNDRVPSFASFASSSCTNMGASGHFAWHSKTVKEGSSAQRESAVPFCHHGVKGAKAGRLGLAGRDAGDAPLNQTAKQQGQRLRSTPHVSLGTPAYE